MNFKVKIFIAAIGILISALILNSLLSISFFENIYSRSLTSILESAGKNLQQRIERGIRLGKPLDAYEGISERLEKFLDDNPAASGVAISDAGGDILHSAGTASPDSDILALRSEKHLPATKAETHVLGNNYFIYVPLFRKDSLPVGAVLVTVSRDEATEKIRQMITGALVRLGWTLAPAALVLVLILGLFVVRPIKRDLGSIRKSLLPYMGTQAGNLQSAGEDNNLLKTGSGVNHNEIRRLGAFLYEVAREIRSDMDHLEDIGRSVPELEKIREGLLQCCSRLEAFSRDPEVSGVLKNDLEAFLQENRLILQAVDDLLYGKKATAGGKARGKGSGKGPDGSGEKIT